MPGKSASRCCRPGRARRSASCWPAAPWGGTAGDVQGQCPGEPPATQARGRLLTAEGPVAGSPSVMLGKDGDVYRGRGAIEPSRVTSL